MRRLSPVIMAAACWVGIGAPLGAQPAAPADNAATRKLRDLKAFLYPWSDVLNKPPRGWALRISPVCKVEDAHVKLLSDVPDLLRLEIASDRISDDGLKLLPSSIVSLSLISGKITDTGLENLQKLNRLESLDLHCRKVTDKAMKAIAGLKQLRSLSLCLPLMTDAGLKELRGMRQLTGLKIDHFDLSDAALAQLRKALPHLRPPEHPMGFVPHDPSNPTIQIMKWPILLKVSPLEVSPQDDAIRRLNKERCNAALEAIDVRFKKIVDGAAIPDESFFKMAGGVVDAAVQLGDFPGKAMTLDGALEMARAVQAITDALARAGKIDAAHAAMTRYEQLTLQLHVIKAKQGTAK